VVKTSAADPEQTLALGEESTAVTILVVHIVWMCIQSELCEKSPRRAVSVIKVSQYQFKASKLNSYYLTDIVNLIRTSGDYDMPCKRFLLYPQISLLALLQGCGGVGVLPTGSTISVQSDPPGATVYLMGKSVGETPLKIKQMDVFPTVYDQDKKNLYGIIQIKKPGCQDFNKRVSSGVVGKGIDAKLDCGTKSTGQPAMMAPEQTPEKTPEHTPEHTPEQTPEKTPEHTPEQTPEKTPEHTPEQTLPKTIKQRLLRLNELRDEGLITEEEYRNARKGILDAL
jgi:hypothetical protein